MTAIDPPAALGRPPTPGVSVELFVPPMPESLPPAPLPARGCAGRSGCGLSEQAALANTNSHHMCQRIRMCLWVLARFKPRFTASMARASHAAPRHNLAQSRTQRSETDQGTLIAPSAGAAPASARPASPAAASAWPAAPGVPAPGAPPALAPPLLAPPVPWPGPPPAEEAVPAIDVLPLEPVMALEPPDAVAEPPECPPGKSGKSGCGFRKQLTVNAASASHRQCLNAGTIETVP